MPRVAGDKPHYTFVLRNERTGRYVTDCTIELDSVTTIIGRTVAKPMLYEWYYRTTRDTIAGTIALLAEGIEGLECTPEEIIEEFGDGDALEEYLKANGLRPRDYVERRGAEGNDKHEFFERLCKAGFEDLEAADNLARRHIEDPDGFVRGIAGWWLQEQPDDILAVEQVLPNLAHGYCGSVDLVRRSKTTDLKTRKDGSTSYRSDHLQSDGYWLTWNANHPEAPSTGRSVLVVRPDGSFDEYDTTLPEGSFLHVLALDRALSLQKEV